MDGKHVKNGGRQLRMLIINGGQATPEAWE